jgi:hypothetical protein
LEREPEVLGMAPVPLMRSRSEPKPRTPRPTGTQPKLPPLATAPVATAVLEEAPPQAIPVAVAVAVAVVPPPKPRRRFNKASLVCVALGLLVLTAVLAWPLVFPATATQADPSTRPIKEPVKPKGWDGVVREFLIVVPVGRYSDVPGQVLRNPDPEATYRNFAGPVFTWRAQKTNEAGALKVPSGVQLAKPSILFGQAHIYSRADQKVKVHAGVADDAKVWVNRIQVLDNVRAVHPNPRPDDYKLDVNLKAGWNTVLVQLGARDNKDFEFYLAFQGEDLRVSLRPEKTR